MARRGAVWWKFAKHCTISATWSKASEIPKCTPVGVLEQSHLLTFEFAIRDDTPFQVLFSYKVSIKDSFPTDSVVFSLLSIAQLFQSLVISDHSAILS